MQKKMPDYDNVHATIPMQGFSIIYVKKTERTPQSTTVTFTFPDGQTVDYKSKNVILEDFTKEKVAEKKITSGKNYWITFNAGKGVFGSVWETAHSRFWNHECCHYAYSE